MMLIYTTTTEEVETGEGLGDLKLECEGLLLMIRPKVYVIFNKKVQEEVRKAGNLRKYLKENLERLEVGKDIVKHATHGFWGDVKELLRLYVEGKSEYEVKHMVKIRESLRQGKQARVMEVQRRTLRVPWEKEIGLCGMKKEEALKKKELCSLECFGCAYGLEGGTL